MTIDSIPLSALLPNLDNPRYITEAAFTECVKSIKRDFKFLEDMPLLWDKVTGYVWSGNQRIKAIPIALADKKTAKRFRERYHDIPQGHIPASWVRDISHYTDDEKARAAIIANSPKGLSGDWDFDALYNSDIFDMPEILEWGLGPPETPDFQPGTQEEQGRLDELSPKMVKCPYCKKEFDSRGNEA